MGKNHHQVTQKGELLELIEVVHTMYIVGIDIAKRKHEAAVIGGEGTVIIKPFSFTNNCSGYNRLLAMRNTRGWLR